MDNLSFDCTLNYHQFQKHKLLEYWTNHIHPANTTHTLTNLKNLESNIFDKNKLGFGPDCFLHQEKEAIHS